MLLHWTFFSQINLKILKVWGVGIMCTSCNQIDIVRIIFLMKQLKNSDVKIPHFLFIQNVTIVFFVNRAILYSLCLYTILFDYLIFLVSKKDRRLLLTHKHLLALNEQWICTLYIILVYVHLFHCSSPISKLSKPKSYAYLEYNCNCYIRRLYIKDMK